MNTEQERAAFEAWYDKQVDGRIQPFDVWIAATNQARGELDALVAELRRLVAVEAEHKRLLIATFDCIAHYEDARAEFERIKALEPVAWGLMHSKGFEFGSAYAPQKTKEAAEEMARQHMGDVTVVALYALESKTDE